MDASQPPIDDTGLTFPDSFAPQDSSVPRDVPTVGEGGVVVDGPAIEGGTIADAGVEIGSTCPPGAQCDDGELCTENDVCDNTGTCSGQPVPGWQQLVAIDYPQTATNYTWATEQHLSWTVDRAVKRIRVSGSVEGGGYCYAHWGTDHVARYRYSGSSGYYNVDGGFKMSCPVYPPQFDDNGTVKICQIFNNQSGSLGLGDGTATGLAIPKGSQVHVRARHLIPGQGGWIKCTMEIRCD
jgi:hypothetical protein